MISFTKAGHAENERLKSLIAGEGLPWAGYRAGTAPGGEALLKVEKIRDWVRDGWGKDAYLFIGAAGIAVRSIAPFVKDKLTDSPVLVMDEDGCFLIPLLSGHLGGGMELGGRIAKCSGARLVVTTATDRKGKFAVDLFARANRIKLTGRVLAKEISARILQGETVGFYSDLRVDGEAQDKLSAAFRGNRTEESWYCGSDKGAGRKERPYLISVSKDLQCRDRMQKRSRKGKNRGGYLSGF